MLLDKLKFCIKVSLAYFLYFTGVLFVLKAFMLRNKAVVLMYHRVLSESERKQSFSHEGIVVGLESFADQMQYLKKSFQVISLEDFLDRLHTKKPFKKYSCLITFDDGWLDNYTNAYPILKKYDLPAVIFLPVDFIGTGKQFWQEKLSAILFALYEDSINGNGQLLDNIGLKNIAALSPEQAKQTIQEYISKLKEGSPDERSLILSDLSVYDETSSSLRKNIDVFFAWHQVREMNNSGISFGSHSFHHKILTQLGIDDVAKEVNSSRMSIGEKLGKPPRSFCYPNGDYTEQITDLVFKGGYEAAFTTKGGHVDVNDNPFTVKRVNIHEHMTINKPLFLARVLGIF